MEGEPEEVHGEYVGCVGVDQDEEEEVVLD
jgi:hypothetical protein